MRELFARDGMSTQNALERFENRLVAKERLHPIQRTKNILANQFAYSVLAVLSHFREQQLQRPIVDLVEHTLRQVEELRLALVLKHW